VPAGRQVSDFIEMLILRIGGQHDNGINVILNLFQDPITILTWMLILRIGEQHDNGLSCKIK